MKAVRLALASQLDLPEWEVDDRPLHAALRALGASIEQPAWDDPEINWSVFDAVLLRTTWNYAWHRAEFVEWLWRISGQTRVLNRPRVAEWNSHKGYLADLERAGVPIAPTVWLDQGQGADMASIMAEQGWLRGFIKPVFGQTARETLPFDVDADGLALAQRHVDRLLPDESLMVQPYLARVETEGEYSVIYVEGRPCHGTRKIPVAMIAAEVHLELEEPLLYGRADWLRDDEGCWVLTELELVEPSMFFRHGPETAVALAEALMNRLRG